MQTPVMTWCKQPSNHMKKKMEKIFGPDILPQTINYESKDTPPKNEFMKKVSLRI